VNPVQIFRFADDPYLEEDAVFLEAVRSMDHPSKILSSYADAVETHKLSYKIQQSLLTTPKEVECQCH